MLKASQRKSFRSIGIDLILMKDLKNIINLRLGGGVKVDGLTQIRRTLGRSIDLRFEIMV